MFVFAQYLIMFVWFTLRSQVMYNDAIVILWDELPSVLYVQILDREGPKKHKYTIEKLPYSDMGQTLDAFMSEKQQ